MTCKCGKPALEWQGNSLDMCVECSEVAFSKLGKKCEVEPAPQLGATLVIECHEQTTNCILKQMLVDAMSQKPTLICVDCGDNSIALDMIYRELVWPDRVSMYTGKIGRFVRIFQETGLYEGWNYESVHVAGALDVTRLCKYKTKLENNLLSVRMQIEAEEDLWLRSGYSKPLESIVFKLRNVNLAELRRTYLTTERKAKFAEPLYVCYPIIRDALIRREAPTLEMAYSRFKDPELPSTFIDFANPSKQAQKIIEVIFETFQMCCELVRTAPGILASMSKKITWGTFEDWRNFDRAPPHLIETDTFFELYVITKAIKST